MSTTLVPKEFQFQEQQRVIWLTKEGSYGANSNFETIRYLKRDKFNVDINKIQIEGR